MYELYGHALAEGITTDEFFDMVGQAIPLYRNKINFSPHVTKKKAA